MAQTFDLNAWNLLQEVQEDVTSAVSQVFGVMLVGRSYFFAALNLLEKQTCYSASRLCRAESFQHVRLQSSSNRARW
jgi:hypothetical protein